MKKYKIISFERDFDFYVRRAFKHMDIGNIKRALNHLNRASNINPHDISVQFNRAGIMSEIGNLEESNKILRNIVENIDASMGECYFGMGCNYFQMDKMIEAKKYFNKYLDKFSKGEYAEEATELIELIDDVFVDTKDKKNVNPIYEQTRGLIDNKNYTRAQNKIDQILLLDPNDVRGLNLQSILFFYKGDMKNALLYGHRALALNKTDIETRCNLLVIYDKLDMEKEINKMSIDLISNEYQSIDELYKIAIAFGQLRKHYYCYRIFKELLTLFPENILFLHLTALTFYNQKIYKTAGLYWKDILAIDSDNLIALKYLDILAVIKDNPRTHNQEEYRYRLPKYYRSKFKKEILDISITSKEELYRDWNTNQQFRAKILWALKQEDNELTAKSLEIIQNIEEKEAVFLIEEYLSNYKRKSKNRDRAKEILEQLENQQSILIDYEISKTTLHIKELSGYLMSLFEIDSSEQGKVYNQVYNTLYQQWENIEKSWGKHLKAAIEYCYRFKYNKSASYRVISQKHNITQNQLISKREIAFQILDWVDNLLGTKD